MELADAPFLESLLFERSWPLVATLAIGAIALLWHGRARADKRALRAAPILSIAAVLAWGLSTYVTTDREVLKDLTRQLVHATAPMDASAVRDLLLPSATVHDHSGKMVVDSGERIVAGLKRAITVYAIDDHFVYRMEAARTAEHRAQTHFMVRSTLGKDLGGRPVRTEWLVTWDHQTDGSWKVRSIQWLALDGREPPPTVIFW